MAPGLLQGTFNTFIISRSYYHITLLVLFLPPNPYAVPQPPGHLPLKFWQLIIWRSIATILAYIFLSLAYSFVSMAFQINFTHTIRSPLRPRLLILLENKDHYRSHVMII